MLKGRFFFFVSAKKKKYHLYPADSLHLSTGKVNIFDNTISAHLKSTCVHVRLPFVILSSLSI